MPETGAVGVVPGGDADSTQTTAKVEHEEAKEHEVADGSSEVAGDKAVSLSVDTQREDDEEEEAILPADPVLHSSEAPEPITDAPPTPLPPPYGSAHHWCPQCLRASQSDLLPSTDPLALSWAEQAFFACGAEHLKALANAPPFLPPASSLPPLVPITVAVIGPPLSGRTTLAWKLAAAHRLAYISLPSLLASLADPSHPLHSEGASMHSPPPFSFLLSLLELAVVEAAAAGLCGYVLDSWPVSVSQWRALEERGFTVRRVIQTVAGDDVEEQVAGIERRSVEKQARADAERASKERMEAASAAAKAMLEARRQAEEALAAADAAQQEDLNAADGEDADPAAATGLSEDEAAAAADTDDAPNGEQSAADESTGDTSAATAVPANASQADTTELPVLLVTVTLVTSVDAVVSVSISSIASDTAVVPEPAVLVEPLVVPVDPLTALLNAASASLTGEQWRAQFDAFTALLAYLREQRVLIALRNSFSPTASLAEARALSTDLAATHLAYLTAAASSSAFDITTLPFPTTYLRSLSRPFRSLSCVSFHSGRPLQPLSLASSLVLRAGRLYLLCDAAEAAVLLGDPAHYEDASALPADVATLWQGEDLPVAYDGCCPASIAELAAGTREWVLPGDAAYGAVFTGRLYCSASQEALTAFLRAPERLSDLQLPSPLPLPPPPPPTSDELLRSGQVMPFLTQTFRVVLTSALSTVSEHRAALLYPGLTVPKSAHLLLALALRNRRASIDAFLADCALIPALQRLHTSAVDTADGAEPLKARYDAAQSAMRSSNPEHVQQYLARFFTPQS